jgi:hypothetical protein
MGIPSDGNESAPMLVKHKMNAKLRRIILCFMQTLRRWFIATNNKI